MEKQSDYGVTHGLDFARWLTEIAELLKKTGSGDPVAQVCFLEIAKTLERLRRYKKDLILGTHKTMLIVNETPITTYPTAQIIAEPMARLLAGAGLWSVGIDHRIDIRNVEMFARILAHPEGQRPAPEELRYVTLNPVKYLVVKVHEDAAEVAAAKGASSAMQAGQDQPSQSDTQVFHKEADVLGALDDAFAGFGETDDPLKAAAREMARTIEQVMPSLEKLSQLDNQAPKEFLRGYFEKQLGALTAGRATEDVLGALGTMLRALSPDVQDLVFQKRFKKADREDAVDAIRCTSPEFRTNFLLSKMKTPVAMKEVRSAAELLVPAGGEVAMVEHIARRLLAIDITAETRANLQKLLGVFGFDPTQAVRRRIVLFIGKESDDSASISKLLGRRGYGVILWDGHESDRPPGQETDPDIVIMDATSAGEHGHDLLAQIAQANKKTPIVVLTDGTADTSPFFDLGIGRVNVLQRPVPNDVLLSFFEDTRASSRASVPAETPGKPLKESTSKFIKADLARAREIQERLIPRDVPVVPGGDIAIAYKPCAEVGGDYLDLFWVAPNQLGFVIADVSGKGVAAAMVMVMARSVFRTVAAAVKSPRETILNVNRMLARDVKKGIFVSAIYGVYDADKARVTLSNGGHNPPVLWKSGEGKGAFYQVSGMALGLTERSSFENSIREVAIDMTPGDKLVFYTDGVTEAFDKGGQMYGDDRLQATITKFGKSTSKELLDRTMQDIDLFVGKAPRSDDITLLVVGRNAGGLAEQA